ncbi:MAG: hypothetical protein Q8P18_07835 [Pseudomonadota bacterium]|nr:hypothetical protein [Pseudomonadota bacterium]
MILILLAFPTIASAADPSAYALVAPVTVPPTGPARITLGPDLVGAHPDALASQLLLTDANGVAVPYAVLRSTEDSSPYEEDLDFRPLGEDVWETSASDTPVDALELDVMDLEGLGPFIAKVQWRRGDQWVGPSTGAGKLLYHLSDGSEARRVEVPHVRGPFRVELTGYGTRPRLLDVSSLRELPGFVPPVVEWLPLADPVLTEEGTARYTVRLGGPRAVKSLRFDVPAGSDVFQRNVRVRRTYSNEGVVDYTEDASGTIRRIRVGGGRVDQVEVPVGFSSDTLILDIATDRGEPLPIDGVNVVSEGAQLLVRDAGAGPHTLYGAASESSAPYDLGVAAPELLASEPPLVVAGSAAKNPGFVPTPTREGVDAPGLDLPLARFHFERDIVAEPGWARIPLDRTVLARTREDLGDVRLIDAEGRQVPFLLWQSGAEDPWDTGPIEHVEKGSTTELRVRLDGTAPVASVLIETSQSVFERDVEILRDAGRSTIAIRRVHWQGPQRGGTLAVALGERLGDVLLVRIENGDNPPITIDSVRVTTPRWELRARIPEGGARLVYGAPGAQRPAYDLSLLEEDVRRMPLAEVTLGEERPLTPPKPGIADRGLSAIGIGLLAIGLLGMVVRVLRGVPAGDPAAE